MKTIAFRTVAATPAAVKTELLLVPVFETAPEDGVRTFLGAKAEPFVKGAQFDSFKGKVGQASVQVAGDDVAADRVMLVGLGKFDSSFSVEKAREALTAAFKKARALEVTEVTVAEPALIGTSVDLEAFGRTLAEVAGLVGYVINHRKTERGGHKPEKRLTAVSIATTGGEAIDSRLAAGMAAGKILADAVCTARDMVNDPSSDMTPNVFAACAKKVADASGGAIDIKLHRRPELEAMGAHAFLAVNRGSVNEPVLVEMTYFPADADPSVTLALVGKTVTFDTGGYDIKTGGSMLTMKCDMSGGAATMQAIGAIAALKLPVRVKAIMAATENMISGNAYRPGDVLGSMAGLTIEVGNTDAEGRLTLADAIEFAKRSGATHIVDIATLTGAIRTALGDHRAGAFTNNAELMAAVKAAADASGELVWELPMDDAYGKLNDTPMADLKNTGGPAGGSISAAWFLRRFADQTPWVHLDIAAMAFRDSEAGLYPRGGTGFGVRLLVELARRFAKKS